VIFGIATGDNPSVPQVAGIACALAGVGLASIEHHEGSPRVAAGVGLALLAAVGFGFYFPWMHAAGKVDFWWASLVFRATALLLLAAVVAARPVPLRLRPRDLVVVFAVGIGDTLGNVFFAASSSRGLVSLTSVLASLYPVVTVVLAASVLHERVARMQRAGIALTLTGVVLISL
jgi:drug/metabolite transporter (DMT)-like permease